MDTAFDHGFSRSRKVVNLPVFLALLGMLLFLRIILRGGMIPLPASSSVWFEPVFDVGTFLLTAILIWLERDQLEDFHITPLALGLILLFKPLMPLFIYWGGWDFSPLSYPKPVSFVYIFISIGLLAALRFSGWHWKRVAAREWKWLGLGLLAGLATVILLSLPYALTFESFGGGQMRVSWPDWKDAFIRIPQQMGYAAITEEPLFRGFLWGYLLKVGWKDRSILIFQTVLFMLGHFYYFTAMPLFFWYVVPVGGIVLGMLVWRSRTLASSLACHAIVNAFTNLAERLFGVLFLR